MDSKRILQVELPKRGKSFNIFCASDWHTHAMHIPTWEILKQHALTIKKSERKLIINGDFLDCLHLMGKATDLKQAFKTTDNIESILIPESEDEFAWGNNILDQAQEIFPEIYYILGNHDWRYINAMSYCPIAYQHNFSIESNLNLKKRKIQLIGYPDYLDWGKLTITHGVRHGNNHNKQMHDLIGRSVLYGHVHHFNCTTFSKRGIPTRATSMPSMSDTSPSYQIKRGENNWSNGFANILMRSDGTFNLYINEVINNELRLPSGKKFKA